MLKDQMCKEGYCKMERGIRRFVQNLEKKHLWICTSCQFTTSDLNGNKMPDTSQKLEMERFWEDLEQKRKSIREHAIIPRRSR